MNDFYTFCLFNVIIFIIKTSTLEQNIIEIHMYSEIIKNDAKFTNFLPENSNIIISIDSIIYQEN